MHPNVVALPSMEFRQRVAALEYVSSEQFMRLLIEAFQKGFSREPLAKLIQQQKVATLGSAEFDEFRDWQQSVVFRRPMEAEQSADDVPDAGLAADAEEDMFNALTSSIMDEVVDAMGRVQEFQEEVVEKGNNSDYGFFEPAWFVEGALWKKVFGDHDPASVIAFYGKHVFRQARKKPAAPIQRRLELIVDQSDEIILDWILHSYAEHLSRHRRNRASLTQEQIKRGLIASLQLHECLPGGVRQTDDDFCKIVSGMPEVEAKALVRFWAGQDFSFSYARYDGLEELLETQVRFMALLVLRFLGQEPDFDECQEEVPAFESMEDRLIEDISGSLYDLGYEDYIDELRDRLAKAYCVARPTKFRGVFPFSFDDSDIFLGSLFHSECVSWPVHMARYRSAPHWGRDPLLPIPSNQSATHDGDYRIDQRAVARFQAFKVALSEMQKERLDELAAAWWAFFIASQAIGFKGMGLPTPIVAEVADIAGAVVPSECVRRALQFAVSISEEYAHPLEGRSTRASFEHALADLDHSESVESDVTLVAAKRDAENWIRAKIGDEAWSRLDEETRRDLVEAERFWAISSVEAGAGRKDWGAVIIPYAATRHNV